MCITWFVVPFVLSRQRCALFLLSILFILLTQFQTTMYAWQPANNVIWNECTFHYQMFIVILEHEFHSSQILTQSALKHAILVHGNLHIELYVCFDLKSTLQISAKFKWHTHIQLLFYNFIFVYLYKTETYMLFIACITVIDLMESNLFSIFLFLSLLKISCYPYYFICINVKMVTKFLQLQKSIRLENDMINDTIEIVYYLW